MDEEIQKIKASELQTIRIVEDDGKVLEMMPIGKAVTFKASSPDQTYNDHLNRLAAAITYFSHTSTKPMVEFVIPFKR